eukprot:CAMPEP_0184662378 /NCGR_PEP_ID=MMETSP0308-20130426/42989_1 /TAXON_ID=38269 /ORGANISM="Gloeochaete witrockiana, Strain SAG 46.84" /LENGTH=320 /DNA_ID=CAMNT_0027104373 /DNA_START=56 /DNA_END=1018 /DNA_ORIENTATION=-
MPAADSGSDGSRTFDPGHEDMIHDLAMDYYGKRLATCSSDRLIKIFDVSETGTDERTLQSEIRGHEGPVWQVSWAHPKFGSILASCSYDRRVCIWKESPPNQWTKIYEYMHESSVNAIAWAPHEYGLILACASSDSTVSILSYRDNNNSWEVQKIQAHNIGCNAVSWAPAVPAGSLTHPQGVTAPPVKRLVTGGCDNMVKVWRFVDSNRWELEEQLDGHTDWVRDVAWAPGIGLPYTTIASCSQDNTVLIWTQDDRSPSWKKIPLPKFQSVVWRLSWSIIGNILAVTTGEGKVTLWKESLDGEWKLVSTVTGEGPVTSQT